MLSTTNAKIAEATMAPVILRSNFIVLFWTSSSSHSTYVRRSSVTAVCFENPVAVYPRLCAHKHINNFKADQMQDLLEAGYTTILSGGGTAESVAMLRGQIESGAMNGPRLIVSGPVNVTRTGKLPTWGSGYAPHPAAMPCSSLPGTPPRAPTQAQL
jgi:hypothetical protein